MLISMKKKYVHLNQSGFTLIELMIGMVLGLFLIAAALTVLANQRASHKISTGLSTVQENGRFALDVMGRDIRSAGFLSTCLNSNEAELSVSAFGGAAPSVLNTFFAGIYGYEAVSDRVWLPTLNYSVATTSFPAPKGGSDIITLRLASGTPLPVIKSMSNATDRLTVANNQNMEVFKVAVACDATGGDIFPVSAWTVKGDGSTQIEFANALSRLYATGSEVRPLYERAYFVAPTLDGNGSVLAGQFSLYAADRYGSSFVTNSGIEGAPTEIARNIEALEILYGVQSGIRKGLQNSWQTAQAVNAGNNWQNVVAVKLRMLVKSEPGAQRDGINEASITFNGNTYNQAGDASKDYSVRRIFESEIALRNRTR